MQQALRVLLAAVLVLFPGHLSSQAAPAAPGAEEAAVRAVLEKYLHGLKFNDTLSLGQAFWPQARLFYAKRDGTLGEWTQSSWYASFAGNVGKEEKGDLKVTAVEVTRDIASATVVEEYPGSRYIDYISLLRINGRWWIVNKLYTSEPR